MPRPENKIVKEMNDKYKNIPSMETLGNKIIFDELIKHAIKEFEEGTGREIISLTVGKGDFVEGKREIIVKSVIT